MVEQCVMFFMLVLLCLVPSGVYCGFNWGTQVVSREKVKFTLADLERQYGYDTTTKKSTSCTVQINRDLSRNEPVFLNTAGGLWIPEEGKLKWQHGQASLIACPNSNLQGTANEGLNTITCEEDTRFWFNNYLVDISSIRCNQRETGNIMNSTQPMQWCPTGRWKNIGFNIPRRGFVTLYNSCFDEFASSVLFTRHTLYGSEIQHKMIGPSRPSFKRAGFTSTIDVVTRYSREAQRERLDELSLDRNAYSTRPFVLERGHLVPDADNMFVTWQGATYFYVNAAPTWEKINNGNWGALEAKIRNFASQTKQTYEVYTGTNGTLFLNNTNGVIVDYTLDAEGIPVPRYLWKIVKRDNAAIAFVVSNNPFERDYSLCGHHNIFYGWIESNFHTYELGFVDICASEELRGVIPHIPEQAFADHVLHFSGEIIW